MSSQDNLTWQELFGELRSAIANQNGLATIDIAFELLNRNQARYQREVVPHLDGHSIEVVPSNYPRGKLSEAMTVLVTHPGDILTRMNAALPALAGFSASSFPAQVRNAYASIKERLEQAPGDVGIWTASLEIMSIEELQILATDLLTLQHLTEDTYRALSVHSEPRHTQKTPVVIQLPSNGRENV